MAGRQRAWSRTKDGEGKDNEIDGAALLWQANMPNGRGWADL